MANQLFYNGTCGSGGKTNTTTANQTFTFKDSHDNSSLDHVWYLKVENFTATSIHIKINSETVAHEIDATSGSLTFEGLCVKSFTIVENASNIRWVAMF